MSLAFCYAIATIVTNYNDHKYHNVFAKLKSNLSSRYGSQKFILAPCMFMEIIMRHREGEK